MNPDPAVQAAAEFDKADAEAQREDAMELCWQCPLCGGLVPMSIRPGDHACTLNKFTPALVLAASLQR